MIYWFVLSLKLQALSSTQLLLYVLNFISHMHFNLALLMAPAFEFEETMGNNARISFKSTASFYYDKEITDSK